MVTTIDGAVEHYRNGNEHDMRRSKPDTCGLLVLDDVGVDTMTEWASGALDRIINRRHEQMLPTWVTTNLDPSDGGPLHGYFGQPGVVAFFMSGTAHVVLMGGKMKAGMSDNAEWIALLRETVAMRSGTTSFRAEEKRPS